MDEFFALNRLSAYLDGDLSEAEAAEVARAIEENDEVRAAWEEMRASVAFVRRHGPRAAPARFHMQVMAAVEALPSPASPLARLKALLRRVPVQAVGVAAVAVLVLVVVWQLPDRGPAPPPVTREAAAPEPAPGEEAAGSAGAPQAPPPPTDAVAEPAPLPAAVEKALESAAGGPPAGSAAPKASGLGKSEASSPYIPDWETQGSAGEDAGPAPATQVSKGLLVSPFVYRLYPEDQDVLRQLAALAERLGGALVTPEGGVVDPYLLTVERNHAGVVLRVPAGNLEQIEPTLRRLGGILAIQADEERLYGGATVDVAIEVIYRP